MPGIDIDEILQLKNNRRDNTAGFTGNRLFVESLDDAIGFRGKFGVFHDCRNENIEFLKSLLPIELFTDNRAEQVLHYDWAPTHIKRLVKCHYVDYIERKTISRDDVALSEVKVINRGPRKELLMPRLDGDREGRFDVWGQSVYYKRGVSENSQISLAPGESCTIIFAAAIDLTPEGAEQRLGKNTTPNALNRIIAEEKLFYLENVPEFHCEDELIEQIYYYRHYVLRHNVCKPDAGYLLHPVFFEGRTMGYGRMITASASLTLDECRWWRSPDDGYGQILTLVENLPKHGIFRDIWVNKIRDISWPGYEEWIPRSMADFLLVHPERELAKQAAEAGLRNIYGLLKHKDKNSNLMLNPGGHHMTQEHSPAFTYFHNYQDWYDYTDVERIEYQAFFYGSIMGVKRLLEDLGDSRSKDLKKLGADVKDKTLNSMWHKDDKFFYAVRESDGAYARCKEGNGFLAFLYNLVPFKEPYTDIFKYFIDDKFFWNPYPIASCAKDIPSYSPHQHMWGSQKKRDGCTWSGPTWPYFNSLFVNVLAGLLRYGTQSAITSSHLRIFFDLFTQGHFENGIPMIRENWDGINGHQRGCPDYLHSTYIDLVVRHLMGFLPEQPDLPLCPLMGINAELKGVPCDGKLWHLEVSSSNKGKSTSCNFK